MTVVALRDRHLVYVCPVCESTWTQFTRCCGFWPFAVDILDDSIAGLCASLLMEGIAQAVSGRATTELAEAA